MWKHNDGESIDFVFPQCVIDGNLKKEHWTSHAPILHGKK